MQTRDIPNVISSMRIVLVLPIVWLLATREFSFALALFFIAGLSDAVDGYLARRNHWRSRLGSILDPLADKILLVSSFVVLSWVELLPVWLLAIVILRDTVIVVGGLVYHYSIERFDMEPSLLSKLNTFLQILLIFVLVFSAGMSPLHAWVIELIMYSVASITLISGLNYIVVWGQRAHHANTSSDIG